MQPVSAEKQTCQGKRNLGPIVYFDQRGLHAPQYYGERHCELRVNLPTRPISVGMTLRIAVHYSNGFGLAKAYCKRPLYED
jgi:hypothetical protein